MAKMSNETILYLWKKLIVHVELIPKVKEKYCVDHYWPENNICNAMFCSTKIYRNSSFLNNFETDTQNVSTEKMKPFLPASKTLPQTT